MINDSVIPVGCFWDETIGGPDNGFGTGLPTAQMMQRSTFESAGWDFTDTDGDDPVWTITEGATYPQLYLPVPISSAASPFTGELDGRGHRITGLYINRPAMDQVGLFSAVGSGGKVRALAIESADITGGNQTGGLAGVNAGTVNRCYVQGAVTGANETGGLPGKNQGTDPLEDGRIKMMVVSPPNGAGIRGGAVTLLADAAGAGAADAAASVAFEANGPGK